MLQKLIQWTPRSAGMRCVSSCASALNYYRGDATRGIPMVVELSLHGFAGFRRLVPLVLVSQRLEVGWSCGTSPSFPRSGDGSSDAGWADQSPTRRSPASNQCGVTVARSVLFLTTNILRAQMGMEGQGTGPDRAAARHLEQGGAGQPRRFASVFVVFRGDTSRCMKRRLQGHLVVEGGLLARSLPNSHRYLPSFLRCR